VRNSDNNNNCLFLGTYWDYLGTMFAGENERALERKRRKLNNEEFHNVYSSANTIILMELRKIRQNGHVTCMMSVLCKMSVGKTERNRSPEIHAQRKRQY
jgi:hypothetical protein